ncbi:MAG: hypothetical protein AAFX07_13645 [Pseudomonadota bacterium]
MDDKLSHEDWDRIAFALSQYSHNPAFQQTLSRVTELIAQKKAQDGQTDT